MRQIVVKYDGECRKCGNQLVVGQAAMYEKSMGIFCVGCEPKDTEEIRQYRTLKAERRADQLIHKAERLEAEAGRRAAPTEREALDALISKGSRVHDPVGGDGKVLRVFKKSYRIKFDRGFTWTRHKSYVRPINIV